MVGRQADARAPPDQRQQLRIPNLPSASQAARPGGAVRMSAAAGCGIGSIPIRSASTTVGVQVAPSQYRLDDGGTAAAPGLDTTRPAPRAPRTPVLTERKRSACRQRHQR